MKLKFLIIAMIAYLAVNAQDVLRNYALFDYNSYELNPACISLIDEMLKEVGTNKITKVELYGHTDSKGTSADNTVLSENRVNSVKTYLQSKGISSSVFITGHYGESKPAFPNTSEEAMQQNRRVEVIFTYESVKRVPVTPAISGGAAGNPKPVNSNKCLPDPGTLQVFNENSKREIRITGANGTKLTFQKNCFTDVNGHPISGEVTIKIAEVYTKDQMILHNLSTMSNKTMLESAGMLYITAENKDGEVLLNPFLPYTIEFASDTQVAGMQLFYGDTTTGVLNWVPAQTARVTKDGDWDHVAQQVMEKYLFPSSKLGWVNCDRFIRDYNVADLYVETTDTAGVSFCLVFKDFNCVMTRDMNSDRILFRNVPIGQAATIVAFRKTETGAYFASEEVVPQGTMGKPISFSDISQEAFEKKIAAFR